MYHDPTGHFKGGDELLSMENVVYKGFNSVEELIDNINRGGEIEFEFQGEDYSITHSETEIFVLRAYDYSTLKTYQHSIDVLAYEIGNKKLGTIIKEIVVKFRCF